MNSPSPVKKRLGSLITALVIKANTVQAIMEGSSFALVELAPLLDGCSVDLLAVENLLTPAYAFSPSGNRYSQDECAATAQITASMMVTPLAMLVDKFTQFFIRGEGPCDAPGHTVIRKTLSTSISKAISMHIITILTRTLLVVHFTLEHIGTSKRAGYVRLIHSCNLIPHCFVILSFSTLDFRVLSASSSAFLSEHQDRLRVLLCGAVLSCTLGEYCHAAYGDVRWSSDVTEEMADQGEGGTCVRPSKKEVWAQLRQTTGTEIISKVTQLLTTAAEVGTFYSLQSPLYQSLLTPSLGLEMLVRQGSVAFSTLVTISPSKPIPRIYCC